MAKMPLHTGAARARIVPVVAEKISNFMANFMHTHAGLQQL